MKKVILLAVMALFVIISCDKSIETDKFTDDKIEDSYWRFYAINTNPYNFSNEPLSNGVVVKFNSGQTIQILNYTPKIEDESKWISIKDTLNTFSIDAAYIHSNFLQMKTFLFQNLKKESKTKYTGKGILYNISTYISITGETTKERKVDSYFDAVGERLTKEEAEAFINKKYPRVTEALGKTNWRLRVNAPYNPNTTYKSGNGLKDSILDIEFKWYHSIYLKNYYYSSTPDSTSWIQTEKVSESVNGNWWYQTSDSTVLFNLGLNSLSVYQSMKFKGTFRNGKMNGICNSFNNTANYSFTGIKQ